MAQQRRPVRRPPARRPVYARRSTQSSGGGGSVWMVAILVLGVAWFVHSRGGDAGGGSVPTTNDARQLAAQVLELTDDIVLTSATRTALDGYAKGGELANFCGDAPFQLDPLLLQVLLKLRQDGYRVLVNNFGIGTDRERRLCYDENGNRIHDQHVLGRGADLNGIIKKGGSQTNWGDIEFRPGPEMEALRGYADAWLAFLPRNRGGVGQEGCLNGVFPRPGGFHVQIPSGSANVNPASFTDACNHLHLDVRIR